MSLEVIGAGFGRTGTNSLKLALEQLGYVKCHHMKEVFKSVRQIGYWERASLGERLDWDEVFEGFRASVDWPSAAYWKELAEHYPDAKVILGVRDPEAWYRSVRETIYPIGYAIPGWLQRINRPMGRLTDANKRLIWRGTFGGRFEDKAHTIGIYRSHIEEVKRTIPADRLLLHDAKDGWGPLCAFLGKPVPATPYPRVNEARDIKRALKVFRWIGRLPYLAVAVAALGLTLWLLFRGGAS